MRLVFSYASGVFAEAIKERNKLVEDAAAGAIREAADTSVELGRRDIGTAGFSSRWQRGLTSKFFPNNGFDPAALIFHKIPFAGVFEHGVTIRGKPMLWVPIEENLPGGINWSASKYAKSGRQLVSVNVSGKRPLLFSDPASGPGVPLFFGISAVDIRKRFHIYDIIDRVVKRLAEFYVKHLKD